MSRSPLTPAIERARALIASGDLGSAQVLLERAVELGRENLGEDEPDVLLAQRELAGVFLQSDDPMAARRMLEDAYAAGQWRLGDGDPLILHISYDLGVVAQELGNRHEARKAFGRVAANGPSALGDGHRFVVQARSYLGEDPSGATVRPDAPPTQPEATPAPVPRQPTVSTAPPQPTVSTAPRQPTVNTTPPIADVPSVVPVNSVTAALNPATDVPPAPLTVTRAPAPLVPQARSGEADARAALERPTDVLPVTRPVPQPDERSGNPWNAAPPVPEQRRPATEIHQHVTPPAWAVEQAGPAPVQHVAPQPVHQGQYGSVDHPQAVYQPQQHGFPQSTGWPTTPQHDSGAGRPYQRNAVGLTVVATLVALVAVAALVVVLIGREGKKDEPVIPLATASAGPQLGGAPPTRVKLTDRGTSIDVTWRDPSGGKAPFMVTMAREGQQLKPIAQVGLGKTKTTVAGLNPKLQYCFAVVVVYTSDLYASSTQVCTERG